MFLLGVCCALLIKIGNAALTFKQKFNEVPFWGFCYLTTSLDHVVLPFGVNTSQNAMTLASLVLSRDNRFGSAVTQTELH